MRSVLMQTKVKLFQLMSGNVEHFIVPAKALLCFSKTAHRPKGEGTCFRDSALTADDSIQGC